MKSVIINGVEYTEKFSSGVVKIVVLQRGFVFVGKFERDGSQCRLHDASILRTWGTTKGLGEIAEGGPTEKTVLDKCHLPVEFDVLTMVFSLSCNEIKWLNKL